MSGGFAQRPTTLWQLFRRFLLTTFSFGIMNAMSDGTTELVRLREVLDNYLGELACLLEELGTKLPTEGGE